MNPGLYTELLTRHLQSKKDYPWMRNVDGPDMKELVISLRSKYGWTQFDTLAKKRAQRIHDECVRQFNREF